MRIQKRAISTTRQGVTLLELMLSITAAVVLISGLAGIVKISSTTLKVSHDETRMDPLGDQELVGQDLAEATAITALSSSQLSLLVPDRNADSIGETIHYRVRSNVLERAENSTSYVATRTRATGLAFDWQTTTSPTIQPYVDPTGRVQLQAFSIASLDDDDDVLTMALPAAVVAGELLLYVVAIEDNKTSSFSITGGGWQDIARQQAGSNVTMCSGWKTVSASEPTSFVASWSGNAAAVGWIFRFSGAASPPIHSYEARTGYASSPQPGTPAEPFATGYPTATNLSLLRLIAFEKDALVGKASGLPRCMHLPLLESPSGTKDVQTVVTFKQLTAAGQEGNYAQYRVNQSTDFVLLTVALSPAN